MLQLVTRRPLSTTPTAGETKQRLKCALVCNRTSTVAASLIIVW